MGGIGSGNHWQSGAATTDDYRAIDIRWLKREGILFEGASRRITWSRYGDVIASVNIEVGRRKIKLDYRHRSTGSEWQAERYPVQLDATPCHLGGERQWFLCPARGCGRRVAIIYGGRIFACRHCYQLAYASQRENTGDRAARKADRLRERLQWPLGILNGSDLGKPEGMHWRTYERLCDEHDTLSNRALLGMMEHLSRFRIPQ